MQPDGVTLGRSASHWGREVGSLPRCSCWPPSESLSPLPRALPANPSRWPSRCPSCMRLRRTPSSYRSPAGEPQPRPCPYCDPNPNPIPSPNPYPKPTPTPKPNPNRSNTFLTGRERPSTAGPTSSNMAGREREVREQPVRLPVAGKEQGAARRMLPGKDGRLYKAGRGA